MIPGRLKTEMIALALFAATAASSSAFAAVTRTAVSSADCVSAGSGAHIIETPVYKLCLKKGQITLLYLKQTSSPATNILYGTSALPFSTGYGSAASNVALAYDAAATETIVVDTSTVVRIEQSGALKTSGGTSYGNTSTRLIFYEDRFLFDTASTLTSDPGATRYLSFPVAYLSDARADETYWYSTGNSGSYTSRNPATTVGFPISSASQPLTYQLLLEMGATDGLMNLITQNISNFASGTGRIEDQDLDTATQIYVGLQELGPAIGTTYQAATLFDFDATTTGYNTTLTEQHQDDFTTPATLDFAIAGGDGALTGDGFAEVRGAYTLDDNDADDHVRFQFTVGAAAPRYAPVFEISNWNSAAPNRILVGGLTKVLGTDYNAAVSGTTLYLQYLSDLSVNTSFEIGNQCLVTSTADSGANTLRECLTYAAGNAGTTISFNIPGPGNQSSGADSWWRISPATILPAITANSTIIDGTTQTTNQGNTNTLGPEIELYGAAGGFNGFTIQSASNTIRGFILTGFGVLDDTTTGAVLIDGAAATGNTVAGNYIGTNYAGTAAPDDATYKKNERGIYILNGATSNTIGGTTAADRNIIAGQRSHGSWLRYAGTNNNIIIGNYIGTNAAGTAAIANSYGIYLSTGGPQSNRIGGTTAGERNIISGNTNHGIWIRHAGTTSNQVIGNYIGTDANGTAAIPNGNAGLYISTGTTSNTIGGATAAERNIISGNTSYGVWFNGTGTNSNNLYGNYIGLDKNGTAVLPNGSGVLVEVDAQSNAIGGSAAGQGNIISGNTNNGAVIGNGTAISNINVYGNKIGTGPAGTETTLGNGSSGIIISSTTTPSNITIGGTNTGEANLVAYQGGDGIYLSGATSDKVIISGNSIHSNTGLGIDLDPDGIGASGGANNDKVRPTITSITPSGANFTIVATVTASDTIEFFRVNNSAAPVVTADGSGSGEGYLYLGKCVDNGACSGPHISAVADANAAGGTVQATLLSSGLAGSDIVSATATDGTNGTSEFSANMSAPVPYTVSGTAYSDAGVTNVGSGYTVRMISGGADVGSAVTNASGVYSITVTLSAGTPFLVYMDGSSNDATTVSLASGAALSGIDLYQNHAIVRSDNGGSLTNANMNTALGSYSDNEIHYIVTAGAVTIDPSSQLYIPTGHSYTPGGDVTTELMESKGTFVGGNYTLTITTNMLISGGSFTAPSASGSFTVGQDFTVTAGTFTHNSGTVTFNTDGGNTAASNTGSAVFNNVTIVRSNYTINLTGTMNIDGNLTLTAIKTLNGGTYLVGGNISTADSSTIGTSAITLDGAGAQIITSSAGGVFPGGTFTISKASGTASLATDISLNGSGQDLTITSGTLSLAGFNLSGIDVLTNAAAGTLQLKGSETLGYTTLTFNTGSTVLYYGTTGPYTIKNWSYKNLTFNGAATTFNLGAALNVAENLTITAGTLDVTATNYAVNVTGNFSNSGTFTARSGTVTLNGTNQTISGNTTFNNLTKSVAAAATLTFAAGSTTTVNGTATLNGAAGQLLTLASSSPGTRWNLNLGASATKTISYVTVSWSDASASDASKKPVNPTNSTDGGNNIDWFLNLAIVKQAWEENGASPLASPSNIATGATFVFLIYVKNDSPLVANDTRINDNLDETAFQYIDGSLFRTSAATPPADTATDKQIFDATASGTGTNLSEAVDGDVGSSVDTGGGSDRDRITVGAVTGQSNAALNIPANKTFAIRFKVKVK